QQPMHMRLDLPEGVQVVDGWVWPPTSAVLNAGEHVLTQKVRVNALTEAVEVKVMLTYQACNAQMCLPVEMLELNATLSPGGDATQSPAPESAADHVFKAFEREVKP